MTRAPVTPRRCTPGVALAATLLVALCGAGCAPEEDDVSTPSAPNDPAQHDERAAERERLVDSLARQDITDPRVLDALRAVPRHRFMPPDVQAEAYRDAPAPIGHGQTISQPYVVGFMTQAAELEPDEKVLEVGTGSGYQAAVLAEITPHVWSIEIVQPLCERAALTLDALGYDAVEVRCGDGYAGWPEHAPFDAIVVTAAPDHVPPALLEQLAVGGRMIIPVGPRDALQHLQRITKLEDGSTRTEKVLPVRFVPMTGEAEER